MKAIFEFNDYKPFVREKISKMPSKGRGQYRRLADFIGAHTTLVSQIFNGDRHLNSEQAYDCSRFFGLSDLETDMFCLLVEHARAGTKPLRDRLKKKISSVRRRSQNLKDRVPQDRELTHEERAVFYSNWYYSAINLLTSIDGYQDTASIAARLDLPIDKVQEAIRFLVDHGICLETKKGYRMGPQQIHLGKDSALISVLHTNWRLKAIERSSQVKDSEVMFTAPMTLSKRDAQKLRKEMLGLIDSVFSTVKDSKEEQLMFFNMDFLQV